eukprot:TRINITY_DN91974_c0_g1_i1.p1 TRINITY_DN91974_c0_g1~~TRINITY_DN91974_c0_g1_i1.p1  ORF type:complete len:449 (+),score=82.31 TRINITY_DN91974_c0_g1_i1:74-1420(+)
MRRVPSVAAVSLGATAVAAMQLLGAESRADVVPCPSSSAEITAFAALPSAAAVQRAGDLSRSCLRRSSISQVSSEESMAASGSLVTGGIVLLSSLVGAASAAAHVRRAARRRRGVPLRAAPERQGPMQLGIKHEVRDEEVERRLQFSEGKVYLVLGATNGIGKATFKHIAKHNNCTVIAHGRDEELLTGTVKEQMRVYRGTQYDGFTADFAKPDDIFDLAENIRSQYDKIHGIVYCAASIDGDFQGSRQTTMKGHELTMAVNVEAPFLLTSLLLPELVAGNGNVVFLHSPMAQGAEYLDDLHGERRWTANHAYGLSKLCTAMMATEMQRRYGGLIDVRMLDPGVSDTRLARQISAWGRGPRKGRHSWLLRRGTLPPTRLAAVKTCDALMSEFWDWPEDLPLEADNEELCAGLWEELVELTEAYWPEAPLRLAPEATTSAPEPESVVAA